MGKFLLRRLVYLVILVVVATSLAYMLAATQLNPRARFEGRNPPLSPAAISATLTELNMNPSTPVLTRYARWAKGVVLHGDLGKTILGQSVNQQISARIWVSVRLVLIGSILGAIIGCALGAWGAVRQYRLSDHVVTAASFIVLAIPTVVLCVLAAFAGTQFNQAVGATQAGHQVFYTVGEYTPGKGGWSWSDIVDRVQHLFLPTLVLVVIAAAFYSRYQRSAMLDVLGQDFLRTAQAKGLTRSQALIKHGLRTALIPLTTFFAYNLALVFIGSVFVEYIFTWHGMGEYLVLSITGQDINSTAGTTLFVAVLVLLAGILSDIAYAALDPRVRVS